MTKKQQTAFEKKEKSIKKVGNNKVKNRHKAREIAKHTECVDYEDLDNLYEDFDSFEKI